MQEINASDLSTIIGGTSTNDQMTQQLTSLTQTIQQMGTNNNNNNGGSSTMMMMAMMMMRPHNTAVVDGGGPPPMMAAPAPAPVAAGPVVNISNRIRR